MASFAVTMVAGPRRDFRRSLREQDGWDEHAAFMDALVDEGLVVIGGPLGDHSSALLFVEAADEDTVRERFAADPWRALGVLEVGSVVPWSIWLDGTRRDQAG